MKMKRQYRGGGRCWSDRQTKWHCEGQNVSDNIFQKLRLWWILIRWALRKIVRRKVISGSILVLVPTPGLWWDLNLYIQVLAWHLRAPTLSFLRGLCFLRRSSFLSPHDIPVQTRQSSFCLDAVGPQGISFQLMAWPRGAPHRALHRAPHTSSRMPWKTEKQGSMSWWFCF